MAKVVKFPDPGPAKFGLQQVRKRRHRKQDKPGQLNLFSGGKLVSLHPLSPFEEALLLDDKGDRTQAKALYCKAIEENDSLPDAYCNLGILESQDGGLTRAIDCFTNSLKNDPRHYEAHYNLANLYAEIGNYALAKAHYEISIEINPTFPNSYFNLGLTLAMNQEYENAVKAFSHYKKLVPDDHQQADHLIHQLSFITNTGE